MGVNNAMVLVLWMKHFLEEQGLIVIDNIVHQDNESTILLEKIGHTSSPKQTHHIEIQYFFITNNITHRCMKVAHRPTNICWPISS